MTEMRVSDQRGRQREREQGLLGGNNATDLLFFSLSSLNYYRPKDKVDVAKVGEMATSEQKKRISRQMTPRETREI